VVTEKKTSDNKIGMLGSDRLQQSDR
jgi:hypothetical protein